MKLNCSCPITGFLKETPGIADFSRIREFSLRRMLQTASPDITDSNIGYTHALDFGTEVTVIKLEKW